MTHILLLEDDASLVTGLTFAFRKEGFALTTARTLAEANALWGKDACDLLVLDVSLPDGTGFEFCRTVRRTSWVPILFLTASDEEMNIIMGLELGGDDYLTKPFLMQELLLRVQHILQRVYRAGLSPARDAPLLLGGRTVDLHDALVTLPDGRTLALTATERSLLRKLAENRGHIVTYDALCEAVWGADYSGYENSLGVHIRHLREKLETEPGRPRFLLTVRGIGYKLAKEEPV